MNKTALDVHTITELSETVNKLENLLKERDKHTESMNAVNVDLQKGSDKVRKPQVVAYPVT